MKLNIHDFLEVKKISDVLNKVCGEGLFDVNTYMEFFYNDSDVDELEIPNEIKIDLRLVIDNLNKVKENIGNLLDSIMDIDVSFDDQ